MRKPNMRKSLATLTFTALTLSITLSPGIVSRYSASADSELESSHTSITPSASSSAMNFVPQDSGIVMPKVGIYALNADNTIFVLTPGSTSFTRLVRVTGVDGNLIGIDFRPADGNRSSVYALTDTGSLYTINLTSTGLGAATLVSKLTTRFPGGIQSLMDFNPVLNALRLIGSDRQNYAVVNNGGNLNVTAVQTALSYDPNDVNKGVIPHVSGGSYTNNFAGATVTLFYGIDYDLDTLVTIRPATPGGSSATGGGVLQTIGRLVTPTGAPVNVSPTTDFDIYTFADINVLVGVSGRTFFSIYLNQIDSPLALGTTENVVVRGITLPDAGGGFIDIAVPPIPQPPM